MSGTDILKAVCFPWPWFHKAQNLSLFPFQTVYTQSALNSRPKGYFCIRREFGAKLTHRCGFWLDVSFSSHVKNHSLFPFQTVYTQSAINSRPKGYFCKRREFGAKLTHRCGFWLDVSFFSHVKNHGSRFWLDISFFFYAWRILLASLIG